MWRPATRSWVSVSAAFCGEVVVEQWEEGLNQRQPPLKVMDAIGLKPGMTIADIGAGRGRYTVWFSPRVGPGGKVYAIDIAFMIDVYHHLDQPVKMIRDTLACLSPGGVVAIVECGPNKNGFDPDHGTPRAKMLRQLKEAGLTEIEVIDPPWLKDDYIYIGRVGGEQPITLTPSLAAAGTHPG